MGFVDTFENCPTAQMAEFMLQNVVYRATVYRTGISVSPWLAFNFQNT